MADVASTAVRTAQVQAIITAAGAGAKLKAYSGALPGSGAPAGTLLATLTGGATIGTATSGVLNWDEAGFTQSNASHVTGTATYFRLEDSTGTFVWQFDLAAGSTLTGTITTGVDVTFNASTTTAGNA